MSQVQDIFRHGNKRSELQEEAKQLRELADRIESGETLAVAWVSIDVRPDNMKTWNFNRFHVRGVNSLELTGAMQQGLHELSLEGAEE